MNEVFRRARPLAALLLAAAAPGAAMPAAPRPLVVIDADPGDDIDDAYALAWALTRRDLDVRAVLVAYGDTGLRVRLVRRMLRTLGRRDVAVGQGRPTPPGTTFTQARWAARGPGGRAPDAAALALELIRRHPGRVTLLALAPLTNVAAMIARDPATFAKLGRVMAMSGSFGRGYGPPGTPPAAEYNAAQRPAGLRALLASGVPVTLFPLDATQLRLERPALDAFTGASGGVAGMLGALTAEWARNNPWKQTAPTLFDIVPVAAAADPALCPGVPATVAVDDRGLTRMAAGASSVRVCLATPPAALVTRMVADLAPVQSARTSRPSSIRR